MTAKRESLVPGPNQEQVSRRQLLKLGMVGSTGLMLGHPLVSSADPAAQPASASKSAPPAKAKAVILQSQEPWRRMRYTGFPFGALPL